MHHRFVRLVLASACLVWSAAPTLARSVGVAAAVNQDARGTPPGQSIRTLAIGTNVIFNERVETSPVGLLQILLADGTAFTVGPNADLSIDRFVYDPDAGTAEVSATLTKGVFRFIGGRTSKTPGGVKLSSPVGTIGIRGAVVDVAIEGPARGRVSLVFGKEVTLTTPGGRVQRIYEPGYSIAVGPAADGTTAASVERTPPGVSNAIQEALTGAPGTSGGARRQPTDPIVASTDVAQENSARPPAVNAVPVPEPRPQSEPRGQVQTAVQDAGTDVVRDEAIEVVDAGPGGRPTPVPPPVVPDLPDDLPDDPLGDWPTPPELADISTLGQIASLGSVNATYSGTAYTAVFDPRTPENLDTYRQVNGSFLMNFDFGSREGTIGITGIEGRSFGAALTGIEGNDAPDLPAVFSGELAQTGGDATGAVTGYFTNGGAVATGVYGGFSVTNGAGDWAATGIVSGGRR